MKLESAYGADCSSRVPLAESARLFLRNDPPSIRIEGYLVDGNYNAFHISGENARDLRAEAPSDPALPHPTYKLTLEGTATAVTSATLFTRTVDWM